MKISKKHVNIIKFCILVLVVVLVIVIIIHKVSKMHDREAMLNKVLEGINNLNYTYSEKSNDKNVIQVMGKLSKKTENDDIITYLDYEKRNTIYTVVSFQYMEKYSNNGIEDMDYYKDYIDGYFNNKDYNYKYKGKKNKNGKTYYVVDFLKDEKISNRLGAEIWIDSQTNVIEKVIKYIYKDKKEIYEETQTNYTSGKNTINDVKVPSEVLTNFSFDTNN